MRDPFAARKLPAPGALQERRSDGATGQASFEEETHNKGRRRDGAGCGRTGAFAVR